MADSTPSDDRTCITCGTSIAHTFKLRRYCDGHLPRSSTKGKRPCSKCGKLSWSSKRECRSCTAQKPTGCPTCGKGATRGICSTCKWRAKDAEPCATCGRHMRLIAKGVCPSCYSAAYRAEHGRSDAPKRMHKLTCQFCSTQFENNDRHTRFCTATCGARNAAGWSTSKTLARRELLRIWVGHASTGNAAFTSGPCHHCGTGFTAKGRARYCSPRCSANAAWKRRYDRRGEFMVSPLTRAKIYARDNHICQLCLEPVDMTIASNDRMGHTLDHIIPQSHQLVPDHSETNLRMAHRSCNSRRGDRVEA